MRDKKKGGAKRSNLFMGRLEKFSRHRLAMFGLVIVISFLILCFLAPLFTKYSPTDIDLRSRSLIPGEEGHLLGTDKIGRDVWARMLYGGRNLYYHRNCKCFWCCCRRYYIGVH